MSRSTLPEDLVPVVPALSAEELLAARRAVLDGLEADERDRSRMFARLARRHAEVARLWGGKPGQGVMEHAGTAGIGQDRASRQQHDGLRLVECFPRVLELLESGKMRQGTAELVLAVTKNLPADLQARVGARVADQIAGLAAADARQAVVTAVAELRSAADAKDAHQRARAQRGVWLKPVEDGMARIGAEVDQVSARRFALDFEELVRLEKLADARTGRARTTQQRRADVLAELPGRHLEALHAMQDGRTGELLEKARSRWDAVGPDRVQAEDEPVSGDAALLSLPLRDRTLMYVHVPVTAVLDLDNRAGYVEGLGVVPAYQARLLRPIASLAPLWVDARTGVPLGVDPEVDPPPEPGSDAQEAADRVRARLLGMLRPTAIREEAEARHDPSRRLRRLVEIRDVRCDGPGCSVPARCCDLDHQVPYAEQGATGLWNLRARSPRCHHAKHDGWTVVRHEDGSSTWTSPTGRTYHRRAIWQHPVVPDIPDQLPEPDPDVLDDADPREDWNLPLWRGDDPPAF